MISWVIIVFGIIVFKGLFLEKPSDRDRTFTLKARTAWFVSVFIASTPFFFEGILADRYVFRKDGSHVETLTAPQLMYQSVYHKKTSGSDLVTLKHGEVFVRGENQLHILINDTVEIRIRLRARSYDKELSVISAALKANIDMGCPYGSDPSVLARLLTIQATNEIATIQHKGAELIPEKVDYSNWVMLKTDLESLALHELAPVLSKYDVYVEGVLTTRY